MSVATKIMKAVPWAFVAIAVACLGFGLYLLTSESHSNISAAKSNEIKVEVAEGKPAPKFVAPAIGGGEIRLENYKGKVVVVDFWSIACSPCIEANAHLDKLYKAYRDLGFVVIGLSIDRNMEVVEEFLKRVPVSYPTGMATEDIIRKFGGIFAIPQSFILDKNGNIVKKYEGFSTLSAYNMEETVKRLLKGD